MYKTITEEMFIDDIIKVGDFDENEIDIIKVMYRYMHSEYDVKYYDPEVISKKFVVLSREELLNSFLYKKELQDYATDFSLGNIEDLETEALFKHLVDVKNWNLVYQVNATSFLIDREYMGWNNY